MMVRLPYPSLQDRPLPSRVNALAIRVGWHVTAEYLVVIVSHRITTMEVRYCRNTVDEIIDGRL